MARASNWLSEYKRNVYSQSGEDGIIEKILQTLPQTDNWCVEFGAWDGLFLTNTRNLIETKGYSAVLIEADTKRFQDLQKTYSGNRNIIAVNQFVRFADDDNLDTILSRTPIPTEFDVLSIDIDGNDYHVWKAVKKYRPKVVVIEFNPTIPTPIRFVQAPDPSVNQGCSLLSLVELGKEKGYELVSVSALNAFFVRQEYYPLFELENNAPEALRTDSDTVTYLFSGYDGRVFVHGHGRLPWHGIELKESRLQQLPAFLRTYPGNYSAAQRLAFGLYKFIKEPGRGIRKIRSMVHQFTQRST